MKKNDLFFYSIVSLFLAILCLYLVWDAGNMIASILGFKEVGFSHPFIYMILVISHGYFAIVGFTLLYILSIVAIFIGVYFFKSFGKYLLILPICFFSSVILGDIFFAFLLSFNLNLSVLYPMEIYYQNPNMSLSSKFIFFVSYGGSTFLVIAIATFSAYKYLKKNNFKSKKNIKVSDSGAFGTAKEADVSYLKQNNLIIPKKNVEIDWIAIAKKKKSYVGVENLNTYRHTMVIAPTRQGKGVAVAIPRILDTKDSCFILDLKSELFQTTYEESRRKGKIPVALDPYKVLDRYGDFPSEHIIRHINPLNPQFIDITDDFILDEYVDSLTSALLSDAKYESSHFQEAADAMIGALLEDYILNKKTLVNLFDDFNAASYEEIIETLNVIYKSTESRRALSAKGLLQKVDKKEGGGFLSTTFRSFKYLSSTVWANFFDKDGFDFGELIDKKTDLYFIIPTRMAKQHVKVVRLLLNLFMINFELANPIKLGDRKFEVFIDEAGQIKCTKEIENILEIYGERGICLTTFWQNLEQINKTFDKPGLITEADIIHIFGVTHPSTIKWIQEKAGQQTIIKASENKNKSSSNNSDFKGSSSKSKGSSSSEVGIPLYDSNEISEMDFTKQIIFIRGNRSFMADKIFYYKDDRYMSRAGINYVEKKGLINFDSDE